MNEIVIEPMKSKPGDWAWREGYRWLVYRVREDESTIIKWLYKTLDEAKKAKVQLSNEN